jgi:hypothetical protein
MKEQETRKRLLIKRRISSQSDPNRTLASMEATPGAAKLLGLGRSPIGILAELLRVGRAVETTFGL